MMPSAHADVVCRRLRRSLPVLRAARPLLWLVATALLAFYEFRTTIPSFRNFDDASNFLAGVEMASGNWLLHGWVLAVDNYYPTDIALQALLGLRPLLMQAAESAIWAVIAVLGIRLPLDRSAATRPLTRIGILSLALSLLRHRAQPGHGRPHLRPATPDHPGRRWMIDVYDVRPGDLDRLQP